GWSGGPSSQRRESDGSAELRSRGGEAPLRQCAGLGAAPTYDRLWLSAGVARARARLSPPLPRAGGDAVVGGTGAGGAAARGGAAPAEGRGARDRVLAEALRRIRVRPGAGGLARGAAGPPAAGEGGGAKRWR